MTDIARELSADGVQSEGEAIAPVIGKVLASNFRIADQHGHAAAPTVRFNFCAISGAFSPAFSISSSE